jgi:hypothetical protein
MNHATLKKALSQLKAEDGYLTYYREAPDEEPSKAVVQTFKAIVDSRNKIQIGQDAVSEWGTLAWLEMEEAPDRFRFSLTRVAPILFGPVQDEEGKPAMAIGRDVPEEIWFKSVDLMIRSDRIIETPLHEPDRVFSDDLMREPSLHLRISYDGGPQWHSWYPINSVPSNVRSLYRGCRTLGMRMLGPSLSKEEAQRRAKLYGPPPENE